MGTISNTGRAVAQILLHSQNTANRYIYVSATETTQNELLASLRKKTDPQPWKVEHEPIEKLIQHSREAVARGDPKSIACVTLVACIGGEYGSDFEREGKRANDTIGLPGQTLDSIIAEALWGA